MGDWKVEHTKALNGLAELIYQRIQLRHVDFSKGVRLHLDADDEDWSVIVS